MSAILGRIEFSGRPVSEHQFLNAMQAIAHYGYDGEGISIKGPIALGYRHMSISRRIEQEVQPLWLGPFSIVADAIIDNRDELADALDINSLENHELSDGNIILQSFLKWGEDCVQHIIGDFAFAIWNARERKLFQARDHIGARPLYWSRQGKTLVFSTDAGSLLKFKDLNWRLSEEGVSQFAKRPYDPQETPIINDLNICPAGGVVNADANNTVVRKWWTASDLIDETNISFDECVEEMKSVLDKSIRARSNTDLKIGSHISGGIDSNIVTILSHNILKSNNEGISYAFTWSPAISKDFPSVDKNDERHLIKDICTSANIPLHFGNCDSETIFEALNRPFEFEGSIAPMDELAVARQAKEQNIGIMLSGWGGDEAFSAPGEIVIAALLGLGRYIEALRCARMLTKRRRPDLILGEVWRNGVLPLLPESLYARFGFVGMQHKYYSFAAADLIEKSVDPSRKLRLLPEPGQYMAQLIDWGHIGDRMRTWASWSAENGYQYRYPLTDRRVLELALRFPRSAYLQGGKRRAIATAIWAGLSKGEPKKWDLANERFRLKQRTEALRRIAKNVNTGSMIVPEKWIDPSRFRDALLTLRSGAERSHRDSAELFAATRICLLAKRFTT